MRVAPAPQTTDRGPYLLTRGSRKFFLEDPRPGDFDIHDIAGALSRICRYGGHISDRYDDSIYSVAQHSVYVLRFLRRMYAPIGIAPRGELWALMHDAPEAMYGDNITPIKRTSPGLVAMEEKGAEALREQFNIYHDWHVGELVHIADRQALYAEMYALTDNPKMHFDGNTPFVDIAEVDDDFYPWGPRKARRIFLETYAEITGEAV